MSHVSDPDKHVQWESRLQRFARSSLTVADFCEDEGVSTAAFYQWRRRLAQTPPQVSDGPPSFVPVEVTGGSLDVQIQFPNGVVVSVPAHDRALVQTCLESAAAARTEGGVH